MIFEKIKKIISSKTGIDKESIALDSNIAEDFNLDSIEIFELLSEIEDEFSIEIDEDSYENLKTMQDLVSYIENEIQ
ncbi:MAG: acyl carrier protein [Peptostreptococcaceae bacterium]|jgi:acyl carrier protein 1|nr:acyl carrier protein [Peptostreptococcaceae bacterium]